MSDLLTAGEYKSIAKGLAFPTNALNRLESPLTTRTSPRITRFQSAPLINLEPYPDSD